MMLKNIRASHEPLAMACPQSVSAVAGVVIDWRNDAATFGTAVHDVCAHMVSRGGLLADEDVQQTICRYGLSEKSERDMGICCACARKFWTEYANNFICPRVEVELKHTENGIEYSGHTDVLSSASWLGTDDGRIVRVLDWKTTRLEDIDYRAQMMRYLWLAHKTMPANRFQYVISFLRDQTVEVSPELEGRDLEAYHAEFLARVVEPADPAYEPGGHCTFCPRLSECPAHAAIVRKTVSDLTAGEADGLPTLPARIVDLYERVKTVAAMCDHFREHARAACDQAGGRLCGSNGSDLALIASNRDEIGIASGWPVIAKHLSQQEFAPAVKISKTALLDAMAAKAPRGQKKAVKESLMDELRAAGAVTVNEITQLRMVRAVDANQTKELSQGE